MGHRREPLVPFDPSTTGDRLRASREALDWTLADVCRQVGSAITISELSKIERGKRPPTCAQLMLLAQVLGVTAQALLGLPSRRRLAPASRGLHRKESAP